MIASFLARKNKQTQVFTPKGERVPVTILEAGPCPVVYIKTKEKDGYGAIQLGFDSKNNPQKPQQGHIKHARLTKTPRFLREIPFSPSDTELSAGTIITVDQVFEEGDTVSVTGISKGKGFAGVVKRHHFAGGPATHGQSDRERAPGSIGGTTTPGRVYKGKRMAGRMGGNRVTVKGLKVMAIDKEKNSLTVSGPVPGSVKGIVMITRTNERIVKPS